MLKYDFSFDLEKTRNDIINNKYSFQEKQGLINFLKKELILLNSLDLEFEKNIEKTNNILKNINLQEKYNKFCNIEQIKAQINFLNSKIKYFEGEQDKNIILNQELSLYLRKEIDDKLKFIKKINYNEKILENKNIKLSKNLKITTLNLKKKKI